MDAVSDRVYKAADARSFAPLTSTTVNHRENRQPRGRIGQVRLVPGDGFR
jgi:hypothetical protein